MDIRTKLILRKSGEVLEQAAEGDARGVHEKGAHHNE